MNNCVEIKDFIKKRKNYEVNIPKLQIPEGFATAFIGENGAGKTTLIDAIAGIDLSYSGTIKYFSDHTLTDKYVRENIGYTSSVSYFQPHWKMRQIIEVCSLLFENFDKEKFIEICQKFKLPDNKSVAQLSDGNKMRLMLASVFARQTRLLLMDEPASPLDPVMRDCLCEMIQQYIADGNGNKSVCFSTHNISDMEMVTDYAVIISGGNVAECGLVEDLKEKYIAVKGEKSCADAAKKFLYSFSGGNYGFEGMCLSEDADKLAGMDVKLETPSLHQISAAVLKKCGGDLS